NADDFHSARSKIRNPILKTPQLGVTKRSPVSAIKNQDGAVGREQLSQRDLFAVLVGQRKLWCFLADPRRLRGKRHLFQHIKNFVSKEAEKEKGNGSQNQTKDFATIKLRSPERPKETHEQERRAAGEEQQIRPRKIARDRKLGEEFVAEQPSNGDNE